jgi:hypothetical protein
VSWQRSGLIVTPHLFELAEARKRFIAPT